MNLLNSNYNLYFDNLIILSDLNVFNKYVVKLKRKKRLYKI